MPYIYSYGRWAFILRLNQARFLEAPRVIIECFGGIGVPIPILSEEILAYTTVKDSDVLAPIVDYSEAYPQRKPDNLGEVSYAQLKTGKIKVNDKNVPTASLSSYSKAVEISNILKDWIQKGEFLLTERWHRCPEQNQVSSLKTLRNGSIENHSTTNLILSVAGINIGLSTDRVKSYNIFNSNIGSGILCGGMPPPGAPIIVSPGRQRGRVT